MNEAEGIREFLQSDLALACPNDASMEDLIEVLADRINRLIHADFDQLIRLLYRIDVNENKLKRLLKNEAGHDSGRLIATLIIERQLQKIKTREENKPTKNQTGDDKW